MPGNQPGGFLWGLDIWSDPPQNTANFDKSNHHPLLRAESLRMQMMPMQPSQPPKQKISRELCKHPQVQIVSRDEDSEYVECMECGDVFESSEFKDMAIEEKEPEEEE